MYKILLVDDEILTRDAISQNIPWKEAGFQLIGAAENGKEALEMIEANQPDVVLTDICMPVMDGIVLSACIYERYPTIKVIIISGYDDFEYAKQAIRYEVSNYILKPITACELMDELVKVKEKIEYSLEKQSEFEQAKHEFKKNLPTIRNHFLSRLIEGNYIKNDIENQMHQLNIRLSGYFQAVVMMEVEDAAAFRKHYPMSKEELIDFSLANISEEIVGNHRNIIFFKNSEDKSIFVFEDVSEEGLLVLIEEICRKIIAEIYRCMKIKVCALIGKTVWNIKDRVISYQNVLAAKERKFFLEGHEFIYGADYPIQKEEANIY